MKLQRIFNNKISTINFGTKMSESVDNAVNNIISQPEQKENKIEKDLKGKNIKVHQKKQYSPPSR